MVKRIQHIALILTLLLLGSMVNEAWAGYKVTYHILTLPFTTKNSSDGINLTDRFTNIRVEAIRVIVDDATQIELPSHFKSPLAIQSSFRYYDITHVTKRARPGSSDPQYSYFDSNNRAQIYQYMTTKYEIYDISAEADSIPKASRTSITENREIFVIYEYNPNNTIAKLDGSQHYNIKLGDRFLCFNKDRANRPGAILASNLTEENLTSNDFTYVATPGFNKNTHHNFHFRFKFEGNDPYNITLRNSYNGDATFMESDKALNKTVKKYFKGASLFLQGKQDASNNMWIASDDEIQYTQTSAAGEVTSVKKPGFYRGGNGGSAEMNPIWNSFAMLNADNGEGYVFMATKVNSNGNNWQPGGKKGDNTNEFLYLTGNVDSGNNPRFQWKTAATAESTPERPYEIRTYTYKVKSPLSNTELTATVDMSEYEGSATLLSHVPDKLKRKYATFTGAYKTDDFDGIANNSIATFDDVETANNGRVIWLKYETSMPFETLPKDGSYTDARWYTIRLNGQTEDKNIAFYDTSNGNQFSTGRGSNNDLHQGENSAEAQVAFIGDPFELKIISRKTSELDAANRYIGCATDATNNAALTSQTGSSDISSWEIETDNVSGTMVLRQFGTYDAPKYIGWQYGSTGNPMAYKIKANDGEASRIKVVELEKKKYLYHIVRSDGTVAVKASSMQDVGIRLDKGRIPEIISSPFVGTMTFFTTKANADAGTPSIVDAPYVDDDVTDGIYANVYVRYTVASNLTGSYNVRLNGEYIYWDTTSESIKSVENIEQAQAENTYYQWHLTLSDPYAMLVKNIGLNKYVNVSSWANEAALGWDTSESNASKFIAQSANNVGVYEVMAATGGESADPDASETYYHIGRNDDAGTCIYSNAKYPHFDNALRFRLTATSASNYTYHLIDKSGTDLLTVITRQVSSDAPRFPTDYYSPLVASYHYYLSTDFTVTDGKYTLNGSASELATVGENGHIYVTYDVNNTINLQKGVLYLLKFRTGDSFKQENGADGLTTDPVPAVYPYCNGDCNFFVYGQDEYELQQQGAASTRTRWAWFLESANNDPYHVKICSRQQETYPAGSTSNYNGYFRTYVQEYGGSNHLVTNLAWYGITGVEGTEYMILGAKGQYQLMTSELIDDGTTNERRVVKSFEQYWKTFDTVRKKIYGDSKASANVADPTTVPADVYYKYGAPTVQTLRNYLETDMGFHPYVNWAYAKRWNGCNKEGKSSKGWEEIEHWYQTVNMGDGYFDLVKTTIDPALILIDQHGWEIMRKPLPSSPDDPYKETKYNAIRPYNSPMVKEYIFWSSAKKRTGMHQYYLMDKRIGGDYTSTDLTQLPPYGSENVLDAKGNLNDQYVTYIVKDEYAQSYVPSSKAGSSFLIQQGNQFASNDGTTTIQNNTVPAGGMSKYIVDNIGTISLANQESPTLGNKALWFVKPNANIDYEMGYIDEDKENSIKSNHDWGTGTPNAYGDAPYSTNRTAVIIEGSSSDATIKKYGRFSFSNGFDPYNIQVTSVSDNTKYFVTNATTATLEEGSMYGNGLSVTLGAQKGDVTATWYDNLTQHPTNATFMAVQDASGNMQLMPRFDHDRRVSGFSSLVTEGAADANTHTQLYRPFVYNYRIIDDSGRESLRYRSAGELQPHIPDHFQSPLAKDYKYYKDLALEDGTYTEVSTKADISSNEITEPLAAYNDLTQTNIDGNVIYVRYSYDEVSDVDQILKGKWFTMQLNTKDAIYNSGIKQADISKPASVNADYKAWQWKLLETRTTDPDPYAVSLFNRSQTEGTKAIVKRFALLSHSSGGFALAEAGLGTALEYDFTYKFLNGASMTDAVAATTETEAGFTSTSGTFSGTSSQVKLLDDVEHEYTYNVYTNDNPNTPAHEGKYGVFAISGTQSQAEASQNEFVPVIPEAIRTPLLEPEEFIFYEKEADMGDSSKELPHLYGLYDDEVFVRYNAYDDTKSAYRVPNSRNTPGTTVARADDSNDAALALGANLLYNIIWYDDNMMKSNGTTIDGTANQNLQAAAAYEWTLEGDDPYAIKIKSIGETGKYIHEATTTTCELNANPTTFMLLSRDDYDYGVLAKTGDKATMLSGHGNALTTSAPTKFIIFALATHKVIYHLVLKHINDASTLTIPYHKGTVESPEGDLTTLTIHGTTLRDLTSNNGGGDPVAGEKYQLGETISLHGTKTTYCVDAGHISLGDVLKVPTEFYRPNVTYSFIVEGVYSDEACTSAIDAMNTKYKGFAIDKMGDDTGLLGRTVLINIVYGFQTGLETNAGEGFVTNPSQNKWYTLESKVGDTPWLAQYTNAWGLEVKAGRGTHFTNDYLWSPVGDPYGFKFYNRYIYKNSGNNNVGETDKIMVPTSAPTVAYTADIQINKGNEDDPNGVYELLSAPTDGYFRIHPVVNNSGDQYYFKTVNDGASGIHVKLSNTPTEFTFGLSKDLFEPYFRYVGYIGALKKNVYEAAENAELVAAMKSDDDLLFDQLVAAQTLVYDDNNLEPFAAGYYRLHSPSGIEGIDPIRYASGYTHKTELTNSIPMHFYEKEGVETTFDILGGGYTTSNATRGDIPIPAVEYDPASIFFISNNDETTNGSNVIMSTQGLYVKGETAQNVAEGDGVRAKAYMTATVGEASALWMMDIGGGVFLIHDRTIPANRKYLSYHQDDGANIYDLKLTHNTHTDYAKWCLQPANNLGLKITTHSGGDEAMRGTSYNYASVYYPFDIMLPEDKAEKLAGEDYLRVYQAFLCESANSPWSPPSDLHPKSIGRYNTADNSCPEGYRGSNKFVPAGTPALLAMWDQTDVIKVTIPTSSPSTSLTSSAGTYTTDGFTSSEDALGKRYNILSGKYLEQRLDAGQDVYVFGLPLKGTIEKAGDFETTGKISAVLPSQDNTGLGFYLNANPNKEENGSRGGWIRNNWYVLGNKVYYRAPYVEPASPAPHRAIEFIPVIFDNDNDEEIGDETEKKQRVGDGCIYDLMGRKVATREQVEDGSWRSRLAPGIYILNGRKFKK